MHVPPWIFLAVKGPPELDIDSGDPLPGANRYRQTRSQDGQHFMKRDEIMTCVNGWMGSSSYHTGMKGGYMHISRFVAIPAILFLMILGWSTPGQSQQIVDEFPAPGPESRGLAWDGHYLWCADASTDKIYKLDPQDGRIVSSINFVLDLNFGGITWSPDGYLWISNLSYYYKIDPVTAAVRTSFHCPGW